MLNVVGAWHPWQDLPVLPTGLSLYVQVGVLVGGSVFAVFFIWWMMKTRKKE